MSLETGTTIQSLVAANPVISDPVNQGDDHLRLLKTVLKTTFPGASGQGFNIPLTANETELNYVKGVASPIQTQFQSCYNTLASHNSSINTNIANISTLQGQVASLESRVTTLEGKVLPSGTSTIFLQNSAPTGWTRVTTGDGRMITLGNFSSGGIHSPTIMNLVPSHTHVDTFAVSEASAGAHSHSVDYTCINAGGSVQSGSGATAVGGVFTRNSSTVAAHTHSLTLSGAVGVNAGADNWEPLYINAIRCTKN